ncbi:MAG: proprotein convertase P-domain-containing protein, partial [Ignavibacteriaceae bacterium]
ISQTGVSKIYINGELDTESGLGLPNENSDSLYIGSIKGGLPSERFVGYIDAVKISNYEKTLYEIREDMFKIIDFSNKPSPPNSTVSFNFDYNNYSSTSNGGYYTLEEGAKYSSPMSAMDVPVSPIIGNNLFTFPNGYFVKSSNKRIPEFNTAGYMKEDSLEVSNSSTVSDIKLFIAINHSRLSDLQIKLFGPSGDSAIVWNGQQGINSKVQNIITVFDDGADEDLISNKYVDFGPTIKPLNLLNSAFGGKNPQGIWRLQITDFFNGSTGYLYGWGININNITGVKENLVNEIPNDFQLSQNYPNPFNPSTVINFSLSAESNVKLIIYDLLGREIAILLNGTRQAGKYNIEWDGNNNFGTKVGSGIYFYLFEAVSVKGENFTDSKKMILMK